MEKTVTFNVTDALISPLGLAMLTGAGIADASSKNLKHIHLTIDLAVDAEGKTFLSLAQLNDELGISVKKLHICYENNFKPYATILDDNGAVVDWIDSANITIESEIENIFAGTIMVDEENDATITIEGVANKTIKLDFYLAMSEKTTQVIIAPNSFGGTFYVEADTLYRNQNGQDMAATITFPKVKIQSGFTLSMSPTGDPSTFDFVMDAMPGYTYFDTANKVVCDITIVGEDGKIEDEDIHEKHDEIEKPEEEDPDVPGEDEEPENPEPGPDDGEDEETPTPGPAPGGEDDEEEEEPPVEKTPVVVNNSSKIADVKLTNETDYDQFIVENNQAVRGVEITGDNITMQVNLDSLQEYTSSNPEQGVAKWVGLIVETGESSITNVTYNGQALGSEDVADANAVGAPAGAFVLWLKADEVANEPKTFTLGTVDGSKTDKTITVSIVDAQ